MDKDCKGIHIECESFCWAFTVTRTINTFLIRHGRSELSPTHFHPFICLCSNGNKCVEATYLFFTNRPVNSLFLMRTPKKAIFRNQESHAFSWKKPKKHCVCVCSFTGPKDISNAFHSFHMLKEWLGDVTATPKASYVLYAEHTCHWFDV